MGCVSTAWETGVLDVVGAKEGGYVFEGERMLGAERQQVGVVAGCRLSSKSKVKQNFFRSPRPNARLILAPNGAWTVSCMPPVWSKNRSNTMSSWWAAPRPAPPARRAG